MDPWQHRWVLSGGIGSGKSEVRRLLETAGALTVDADLVGHSVLEPGGEAFDAVAERWPRVVSAGRIDRKALGRIVFASEIELSALEAMTHPAIFGMINANVKGFAGPAVVEIPVLSHGLGPRWRRIVVDAADDVRLERAATGGLSLEEVRQRMERQPSRAEWLAAADLVIPNHGGLGELAETVRMAQGVLGL